MDGEIPFISASLYDTFLGGFATSGTCSESFAIQWLQQVCYRDAHMKGISSSAHILKPGPLLVSMDSQETLLAPDIDEAGRQVFLANPLREKRKHTRRRR